LWRSRYSKFVTVLGAALESRAMTIWRGDFSPLSWKLKTAASWARAAERARPRRAKRRRRFFMEQGLD
jgi:hypothetical protein